MVLLPPLPLKKSAPKIPRDSCSHPLIMVFASRENIAWHTEILLRSTKKALDFLSKSHWFKNSDWYLAGGTALALQAGHRQSVDLDFFNQKKTFDHRDIMGHLPKNIFVADMAREGTLYGRLFHAKISFIAYPFFVPYEEPQRYGNVSVLSLRDIAVMKVVAISQRGRKRDFIDLYWHCTHVEPLSSVVRRLASQYPLIHHNYHHIYKALGFFEDAEEDVMPKIFFKADWTGIKRFFRREAPKIMRERIGLD